MEQASILRTLAGYSAETQPKLHVLSHRTIPATGAPHRFGRATRGFPGGALRENAWQLTEPTRIHLRLIPAALATMVAGGTNAKQEQELR